jgi:hypothetical protein
MCSPFKREYAATAKRGGVLVTSPQLLLQVTKLCFYNVFRLNCLGAFGWLPNPCNQEKCSRCGHKKA